MYIDIYIYIYIYWYIYIYIVSSTVCIYTYIVLYCSVHIWSMTMIPWKGTRDAQSQSRVRQGAHLSSDSAAEYDVQNDFVTAWLTRGCTMCASSENWAGSAFTNMCLGYILTNPLALNVPLNLQIWLLHMPIRSCYGLLFVWEPRGTMAKHSWQSVARLNQRYRQIHDVNRSMAHHMVIASNVKRQWHVDHDYACEMSLACLRF
jgi:hypothetical protein